MKRKLSQGKEVLLLRGLPPHLPGPRPSRLPKPVWVLMQGSLIRSPKVTSASVSPPTPGMIQGGRNGWAYSHIRLGEPPSPLWQKQSWPSQTECPSQPHSWPFIRGGGWASAQAQGTSWLSATPQGGAHMGKKCKHPPTPMFGAPAQGPREPPE